MVEFKPLTKRCNRPAEKIQKVKSKTFFFIKLIINPNNDWLSMKICLGTKQCGLNRRPSYILMPTKNY